MPPHPHGHGGDEEEQVEIKPRVDGPPFVDITAKQGLGFEVDFDKVQKHLGPGKISLADYMRDIEAVNAVYKPSAHRSFIYLQIGSAGMMGGLVIMILMGIIGGTPAIRRVVMPISLTAFLVGVVSFLYSKWVEQGGIREGAQAVRKVLDDVINPRYADSEFKLVWTVSVQTKPTKSYHMGKTLLERPVISIYALRSPNQEGVMTTWQIPASLLSGVHTTISA